MATSKMIDMAAREYKPGVPATMHHEAEAVLTRPRASQDVEAAERAAAIRSTVRMVLGRHNCPRLSGQPCTAPEHAGAVLEAREALQAFGLAEVERATHQTCSTCHLSKSRTRFSKTNTTCADCLSEKKRAREAAMETGQ